MQVDTPLQHSAGCGTSHGQSSLPDCQTSFHKIQLLISFEMRLIELSCSWHACKLLVTPCAFAPAFPNDAVKVHQLLNS